MNSILTVTLPDIGEGVVEGEVIAWLKQPGDQVAQDEPVVVVMTDKATVELPAPQPGTISKHYFKVGEIAIKDKPLYDIELIASGEKPLASPATRKLAKELDIDLAQVTGTGKEGRVTRNDVARIKTSKIPIPRLTGIKKNL